MGYVSSFEPRVVSRANVQKIESRARISPLKHLLSAKTIDSDDVDWFCDTAAAFESGRAASGSTGKTVALLFFQPRFVFDPMQGSGTCADVCRELSIPCRSPG